MSISSTENVLPATCLFKWKNNRHSQYIHLNYADDMNLISIISEKLKLFIEQLENAIIVKVNEFTFSGSVVPGSSSDVIGTVT